ncbi:hypothetical protein FLAG1_11970 [Fusarium langsethiae]|uniref:Uncharacterized protein n=1 Tax=Fusarium langsethiae TaxID=179993 RepID=A0A0M9EL68_FUSLA|nr:hypothetical protein FLAG1_11970 [Fusarium langsethiae]GKU07652.1 unnamed protein product [Fusarium langsethiae]GKU22829.1 unnamed protein product [Fusarium langsethiae]
MLWQYTADRYSIARDILRPILALDDTDTILQDALIIIHSRNYDIAFDPPTGPSLLLARDRPSPIAQDRDMTMKLYRLISFMICWIEDYMGKATDPLPPWAYMALPEMATGWTGTRYQEDIVDIKPVFFSQLSSSERCRFLRAFLRLEVLCRISVLTSAVHDYRPRWDPYKSLLRVFDERDCDSVLCSLSYLRLLYKSVFNATAWVKTRQSVRKAKEQIYPNSSLSNRPSLEPTTAIHNHGRRVILTFPESVCVSPDLYDSDSFPLSIPFESPIFGFSDLSSTLVSANRTGERPNFEGYSSVQQNRLTSLSSHLAFLRFLISRSASDPFSNGSSIPLTPRPYLRVCIGGADNPPGRPPRYLAIWSRDFFNQIHLQRAFCMFKDERFYPNGKSTIPNWQDLQTLADSTWQSFGVSKDEPEVERGIRPNYFC